MSTRDLASLQVQPAVDDGLRGLLDLLHVTDNHLRGRRQLPKK